MAKMAFHFKVEYADGDTIEVDSLPIDIVRWERKEKKSFGSGDPTIESLFWLAWCAARRTGQADEKLFDEWLVKVVDLDTSTGDDDESEGSVDGEVDPFLPEASPAT